MRYSTLHLGYYKHRMWFPECLLRKLFALVASKNIESVQKSLSLPVAEDDQPALSVSVVKYISEYLGCQGTRQYLNP